MRSRSGPSPDRTPAAGFTLVELLVASVVAALIMGAAVLLFNSMNRLSRVQLHQAELQQSVRVAQRELGQFLQMAGRGGLAGNSPVNDAATTPAIEVRTNVGVTGFYSERLIAEDVDDGPEVAVGTDVLIVRGVFSSSILHLDYTDRTRFVTVGDPVDSGTIVISSRTPTEIPQSVESLKEACEDEDDQVPEALVLVNAVDEDTYAVVQLDCDTSDFGAFDDDVAAEYDVVVGFRTDTALAADYARLAPGNANPDMTRNFNPSFMGLLEEYRYYVREERVVTDEDGVDTVVPPGLFRARMYPGTEQPYKGDVTQLEQALADNILDLQVALGYDSSFDGTNDSNGHFAADINNTDDDDRIVDAANASDDWLFNHVDDYGDPLAFPWRQDIGGGVTWTTSQPQPVLYYARITTIGRTARPDRGYAAPTLDRIEDRTYPTDQPDDPINGADARGYRREILQTVIDLRNLG